MLSESAEFYRRHDKNIVAYFLLGHRVFYCCFIRRSCKTFHDNRSSDIHSSRL